MTYRRLTRILHVLLLLSATFVLTMLGVFVLRANKLIDHAAVTIQNMDRTIIIAGASLREIHLAEESQIQQFDKTQQALTAIMLQLQDSVKRTSENLSLNVLPSVTMTVENLDGAIEDFRGSTRNLMANANNNLLALRTTQENLNQTITALDIPKLGGNLNEMAVQGVVISKNTASASGHLDRIAADAQQEADKFVAPKTKWQKFKGAMGVLWRVAAFAIVKSI